MPTVILRNVFGQKDVEKMSAIDAVNAWTLCTTAWVSGARIVTAAACIA